MGNEPTVIVVGGATCDRAMTRPLAEQLAQRFTVINYDRRGSGDSGNAAPYAVDREIEDLGVLIAVAGGTASVYGHSSEPQESFGGGVRVVRIAVRYDLCVHDSIYKRV